MLNEAHELIRKTGDRATAARLKVLSFLLTQHSAVTHHKIEQQIEKKEKIDRVTLYRVLEWLTEKGIIHKFMSGDRAWHFRVNTQKNSLHQHAHFKCLECSDVICLDDVQVAYNMPLPAGYKSVQTELTVKGICARCI